MSDQQEPDVDEIWEGFARARPEYFILTEEVPFDGPVDMDAFFASGRRDAATILEEVSAELQRASCAIDIGCGVGRLAIPMSGRFERVIGVDISRTMLERLVDNCRAKQIGKRRADACRRRMGTARGRSRVQPDRLPASGSGRTVERYVGRFLGRSQQEALPIFEFDTRERSVIYRLRNKTPDVFLPRTSRRGLRRIRRSADSLRRVFDAAGLERGQRAPTGHRRPRLRSATQ